MSVSGAPVEDGDDLGQNSSVFIPYYLIIKITLLQQCKIRLVDFLPNRGESFEVNWIDKQQPWLWAVCCATFYFSFIVHWKTLIYCTFIRKSDLKNRLVLDFLHRFYFELNQVNKSKIRLVFAISFFEVLSPSRHAIISPAINYERKKENPLQIVYYTTLIIFASLAHILQRI
jgi:hypothetical protein